MSHLTDTQQKFLDEHIRKHSVMGARKKSQAKDFLRRKDKTLEVLDKLPTWRQVDMRSLIADADRKADDGHFSGAYDDLKAVKRQARAAATSYSPATDIRELDDDIKQFVKEGLPAAQQVKSFVDYCKGGENDQAAAPSVELACKFLVDANKRYADINLRDSELRGLIKAENDKTQLAASIKEFRSALIYQLAPLRSTGDRFRTAPELKEQWQNLKPREKEPAVKSVVSPGTAETLHKQANQDATIGQQTQEANRVVRPQPEKLDMKAVGARLNQTLPNRKNYHDTDKDLVALKQSARDEVARLLEGKGQNSDLAFDLALRDKQAFAQEYCASRGWSDPTPAQAATARVVAAGMFEAAQASNPIQLDKGSGTVNLNGRSFAKKINMKGQTYSDPQFLGQGTFGVAVKYTSGAGQTVVLKGIDLNMDVQSRSDFAVEAWNNRILAQGQEDAAGRENLLLVNGLVQGDDGIAYMVMDLADGGDLNDTKSAMNAVSESGALPEEARNVLNQYMMKQALEGVKYLRDQNMVHCDLKEANIMITKDGIVKVGDFGGSVVSDKESGDVVQIGGTTGYFPPEYKHGKADTSTKSDTYALGRIVEMLHGGDFRPDRYENKSLTGALKNIHQPMTSTAKEDRPALEAVLGSSYLGNLDNYDPQTVKELMAATVACSKSLKGKKVNDRDFQEIGARIRNQRRDISALEKKLKDPDPTLDKTILLKDWKAKRTELEELER